MKKLISLLLCIMLIVCAAGCTGADDAGEQENDGQEQEQGEEADSAAVAQKYYTAYEAHDPDETVMTVDGKEVTWKEYFYWLSYMAQTLEYYYGDIEDWNAVSAFDESMTNSQCVTDYVDDVVVQYNAVEYQAGEYGVSLTQEHIGSIDEAWEQTRAEYESDEAFEEYLNSLFLDKELFYKLNEDTIMYNLLHDEIFGADGEKLDDDEVISYAEESGYMSAKHILISTVDSEGTTLEGDALAEKKALAESLVAQLRDCGLAGKELEELFTQLMNENSEDTGLAYYPDGYCFKSGEMVAAFENTTAALGEYEVSDIVETTYGYHIILRLPLTPDAIVEYYDEGTPYSLRYMVAAAMFDDNFNYWCESAEIEYTELYNSLDLNELFAK